MPALSVLPGPESQSRGVNDLSSRASSRGYWRRRPSSAMACWRHESRWWRKRPMHESQNGICKAGTLHVGYRYLTAGTCMQSTCLNARKLRYPPSADTPLDHTARWRRLRDGRPSDNHTNLFPDRGLHHRLHPEGTTASSSSLRLTIYGLDRWRRVYRWF